MKNILLLLSFLLFASTAFATTQQTQYIVHGTGAGGNDGTIGNPYDSCSEWAGQNRNLPTEDVNLLVIVSGTVDNGECTIPNTWADGDATRHITMKGLNLVNNSTYNRTLRIQPAYVTIQDSIIGKDAAGVNIQAVSYENTNITVERSIIFGGPSLTRDSGFQLVGIGGANATFRNNIVYGGRKTCVQWSADPSQTYNIYNNTVYGCDEYGIYADIDITPAGSTYNIKNNLSYNNNQTATGATDFSFSLTGSTVNYGGNVSKDTSSPDVGGRSKTITFVNAGTKNFHLAVTDTSAIGQGVDLSGAGVTVDRDNVARVVPYDVGGYKYISAILTGSLTTLKVSGAQ